MTMGGFLRAIRRRFSRRHSPVDKSDHNAAAERSIECAPSPTPPPPENVLDVNGNGESIEEDNEDMVDAEHPQGNEISRFLETSHPTRSIKHHDEGHYHSRHHSLDQQQKDELLRLLRVDFEDAEDDAPPQMEVIEENVTASYDEPEAITYEILQPTNKMSRPQAVPYSMSFDIPFLSPRSENLEVPMDDGEISNLEAGAESTKRSYLSIIPTTIQVITESTALFVWRATFHPALNRRFSGVLISVRFTARPAHGNAAARAVSTKTTAPSIQAYVPRKSFGATTSEQRKIQWGLELPITVPAGPVSLGVTPSGQRETSKDVQHAFTITGSARGTPSRNTCVWTVEENASSQRGIPSELQVAALVQHSGPLMMEVDISGKTAGGFYPSHNLRPKTDAMGRRKDIDPAKFRGLLFEYDFDAKNRIGDCKKMLESWTGKVDGAILEFDQKIVSA